MHRNSRLLLISAGIGAVAGMRSMSAVALAGRHAASHRLAALLKLMAAGEMIVDKTALVPARTEPLPLLGRIAFGGAAAGIVASQIGGPIVAAAAVGSAAAAASTYALYRLRRWIGERTAVPDPVLGAVEDGVVVGVATRLSAQIETAGG